MSLPIEWIDRIFDKLSLTYGQPFLRRWADIDLNAVKSDWAHELAGFEQHPHAIAWALQHLPDASAPTVLEFRTLARKAPPEVLPQLPEPKADPERVKAEAAKLLALVKPASASGVIRTAWAHAIVDRHAAGAQVSPLVLRMAREVAQRYPKGAVGTDAEAA